MRVYVSKNLGHGVRVGASTNLSTRRPAPRPVSVRAPVWAPAQLHAPVYIAQHNEALKVWRTATFGVWLLCFFMYPLLVVGLPMLLILLVGLVLRWRAYLRAMHLTGEAYRRDLSAAEYRHLVKMAKASDQLHIREVA